MSQLPPPPPPPAEHNPRDTLTSEEVRAIDALAQAARADSKSDLWAFAFDGPLRSQEALIATMRLVGRQHLDLEDAAIVTRVGTKVRITQTRDVTPRTGAMGGAWLGILAGLFLGPGGPLIGGALGAAAGGLFGKLRDYGIDDDQMRAMGEELSDGQSALFLLVRDCHRARALHEVSRFPGRLLATTADEELAGAVRERLTNDPWD
ncbi:DUF1269 domain-containing protein [Egicoccus sp. AB-alg6-2]|uniref:DUF1269 domain-containing protein n=1 Tax=Egicoccus sp. AB-alg6-2 TaxID=3242692 RepID=UPI00359EBF04